MSLYNLYYIFSYPDDVCIRVFFTNGFWQSSTSTVKAPAASCSAVSLTFGADEVSIPRPELRRQLIIKSIAAVFRNEGQREAFTVTSNELIKVRTAAPVYMSAPVLPLKT